MSKLQIINVATDMWQKSSHKGKNHSEIVCRIELDIRPCGIKCGLVHLNVGLERVKEVHMYVKTDEYPGHSTNRKNESLANVHDLV